MTHCLGLHTLGRVHQQDGTFTSRQGAGYFIRKIYMPGSINEIECIVCPVAVKIMHLDGVTLDSNSPLPLQLHVIQHLFLHIALA